MSEPVGLDDAGRAAVSDAVGECVQRIALQRPFDPDATRVLLGELIGGAGARYGGAGLFEVACAASLLISGGVMRGALRYLGHGPDEASIQPSTPMQYVQAAFGTAVMGGDRAEAWRQWQHLHPGGGDRPGPDTGEFLGGLLRNAISRQAGGEFMIRVEARRWPPVCDFCCGPVARWMWHVAGADITVDDPRPHLDGASVTLRIDDMEYWYGCNPCKPLVARLKPDWHGVWIRHRRHRPNANKDDVMILLRLYERMRRARLPVPLPAERPLPTPGRR